MLGTKVSENLNAPTLKSHQSLQDSIKESSQVTENG